MKRNFGVQRHRYQPVTWPMWWGDFQGSRLGKLAIVFALGVLMMFAFVLSAKAEGCTSDNNGHTVCGSSPSHRTAARRAHRSPRERAAARPALDANSNEVSRRREPLDTDASPPASHGSTQVCASGGRHCVRVAASARSILQCVVDHVEASGVRITALGGNREGHCSSRHMHSCGKALDINQTARDVNGPPRHISSAAASACGAVSGSWWAGNPDNGHFQVGGWAGTHGTVMTASAHRRHHRHRRLARM